MNTRSHTLSGQALLTAFLACALLGYSVGALAWGPDGHTAVGVLALRQLTPQTRHRLEAIVGPLDEAAVGQACNWPDAARETGAWEWSEPQHYVNIPRGDFRYAQDRDCPNGLCVTGAIERYAAELIDPAADAERRWQSFAWLCHLLGDLHQPLHAGFADDRGGNEVEVVFDGESMNLHAFWDRKLIAINAGGWQALVRQLGAEPLAPEAAGWSPAMLEDWTNESHELARSRLYPPGPEIDEDYAQQGWELARQRLRLAAARLALIITSQLRHDD